ncbi:tight adherence pilus pseudopilin TadF [Vibrio tapetis]|uniref:Uncharacterized protein n=1 Tax=Vibrio tapetis subsp. tapetis TaxID=1671868 RepID=A0A2N8ZJ60_9VIBR|nr:tight adherence pilus pseudopilin TadF [Vibrio tapetis]SON51896.1 conserved protein of unknown function [Vibrio tapetis subsp. tapetis]
MNIKNQKGVFSIELAFVLLGMTAFLFFIFDLGFQVIQKSQLNRTSYAMVSVLKERKGFYTKGTRSTNWDINQTQAKEMYQMARRLLDAKQTDIRVNIGFKSGKKNEFSLTAGDSSIPCNAAQMTNELVDGSKHDLNVYRVTVCRRVPVFFEKVIGDDNEKDDRVLQSTSIFVGR